MLKMTVFLKIVCIYLDIEDKMQLNLKLEIAHVRILYYRDNINSHGEN